jgi:hypothetical protein
LGPEEAELLKRKAIDGVAKFLESGALIADMERESIQSPRLLMQPETKLLSGPANEGNEPKAPKAPSSEGHAVEGSDLSEAEIEELERLVKKAKSSTGKKRVVVKKGAPGAGE